MASETKGEPTHFRFERKFTTTVPYREAMGFIRSNPALYTEIYQERYINNIYFDDLRLSNYFANDDGIKDRLKTRVRWYGDLSGDVAKPALEIKVKRGWAGEKPTFRLQPFRFHSNFTMWDAQDIFRRSDLPGWIRQRVASESPSVVNRYARRYFLSADGNCRLTIDRDLRFYRVPHPGAFVPRFYEPRATLIIELKYLCRGDHAIDRFTNDFRFRMNKFSKYANGVLALYK